MLNTKFLDEIAAKINEAIRSSPAKDIEKNIRAGLGTVFNRLDLVTREEFEVQSQLLLRTRERLESLEATLRSLESRMAGGTAPGDPGTRHAEGGPTSDLAGTAGGPAAAPGTGTGFAAGPAATGPASDPSSPA